VYVEMFSNQDVDCLVWGFLRAYILEPYIEPGQEEWSSVGKVPGTNSTAYSWNSIIDDFFYACV